MRLQYLHTSANTFVCEVPYNGEEHVRGDEYAVPLIARWCPAPLVMNNSLDLCARGFN